LAAAARAYRAILKRAPDLPDALHLLGLTAHQSGDQARAIRHMEKALALQPDEPSFLNNLGLAQHAAGRLTAAEDNFRRVLALAPDNGAARLHLGTVLALQNRNEAALVEFMALIDGGGPAPLWHAKAGQALRQLGRLEEAEAQFRHAVALAPLDMDLLASLASLLQVRGRYGPAADLYRRVLGPRPDFPEVLINLGNCLTELGEIEAAREAFGTALELDGGQDGGLEGAMIGLVYLDEREGAFAAAWERLQPGLRRTSGRPASPAAAGAFATLAHRLNREDEAIEAAEQSLAALAGRDTGGGMGGEVREKNLRFAVGQLYERRGDYDRAFAHFEAGNGLTRQLFDQQEFADHISALIDHFTPSQSALVAENEDQTPVFIVGMPRSGTTLVEQILASHPQVHGAGEVPYLFEAVTAMPINNPMNLPPPRLLGLAGAGALAGAARQYVARLRQAAPGAARITDKLPGNILQVGMIARLFPRAHIIHIRRDAMDTCLSCFTQNFGERLPFTADQDHLAAYYAGYDRLGRHWAKTAGPQLLELSYEGLIADTEGESRRLLEFIGLPWDRSVLDFHTSGRIANTASYDQVRQPIYRSAIGRWRRYEDYLQPLRAGLERRGIAVEIQ
ncbi:MAG: sulfotransferase, partial [Alphaproteobacteria bacterium]